MTDFQEYRSIIRVRFVPSYVASAREQRAYIPINVRHSLSDRKLLFLLFGRARI